MSTPPVTPQKPTSGGSASPFSPRTGAAIHPYAQKLPLPKKTNNNLLDEDNAGRHFLLKEIVTCLINDYSMAETLGNCWERRLAQKEGARGASSDDIFNPHKTPRTYAHIHNAALIMSPPLADGLGTGTQTFDRDGNTEHKIGV